MEHYQVQAAQLMVELIEALWRPEKNWLNVSVNKYLDVHEAALYAVVDLFDGL